MKIEWNRVTWYSKAIALGVFVVLIMGAFYFGVGYGAFAESLLVGAGQSVSATGATATTGSAYYSNPAEWQSYYNATNGGYVISYPIDFLTDENYGSKPTSVWSVNSRGAMGMEDFSLTIPAAFEPQTNFADAMLTVGWSGDATAVSNCLQAPQNAGITSTSTAIINGASFVVMNSSSAGAGNLYDTTSYRTVHNGQCYAIEYTIHSNQIANYPASYNLQPFDQAMVTGLLDRIVGTFNFN